MAEDDTPKNKPEQRDSADRVALGRRRLLHGGLAAGPVLLTLVSRPVLGQGAHCTTPSGFVSLNASNAGRGEVCTGLTASVWVHLPQSQWSPFVKEGTNATLFNAVFQPYTPYNGKTLLDVLGLTGGINDVAKVLVAALLNANAGKTPTLGIQTIKDIWAEFSSTGSFSPSAGASWNEAELLDYLSTTQVGQGPG